MMTRVIAFAWLLLIWAALLGGVSRGGALMGAVLSAWLLAYFRPAPQAGDRATVRPLHAAGFLAYFAVKFVEANLQVARAVLQPSRIRDRRAVVAVPIGGESAFTTLVLANAVCLTPGTFVLEMRGDPPLLFVHVLQLTTIQDQRLGILEMERRLALAFGPPGAAARVALLMARVAAGDGVPGRPAP